MLHPTDIGFLQQRQGKLRFSLKPDRFWDMRLAVSLVYHQAHSYVPALLMLAGLLTVSCVLILYAERLRRA